MEPRRARSTGTCSSTPTTAGVQALVRDLNRIYRDEPALWEVDFEPAGFRWLEANDAACERARLRPLRAPTARAPLVCVGQLLAGAAAGLPDRPARAAARWREVLNTDATRYGGSSVVNGAVEAEETPWHDQPFSARGDAAAARRVSGCNPDNLPRVFTTRPELRGTFGMVASTHWLASAAGMAVLEQGGNAFDAAVAAGLTLQVVEPHLNGPGGDLPALLWPAGRDEPVVLCAQGPAPRAATIARYRDELGLELVPGTGPLAAVVPGAFGGWMAMLRDYGTLPLRDVLRFAIGYADEGYPVLPQIAGAIRNVESLFRDEWTTSAAVYLPGGRARVAPPQPAARGHLPPHPRRVERRRSTPRSTAGTAASSRRRSFASRSRSGWTAPASAIAACSRRRTCATGGRAYEQPLAVDYHGLTVLKAGPWSQAPVFLQQLRLLEGFDLEAMGHASAAYVHTVTECAKLAFADREAWYGDPDFVDVPLDDLLSREYAKERRMLIADQLLGRAPPG